MILDKARTRPGEMTASARRGARPDASIGGMRIMMILLAPIFGCGSSLAEQHAENRRRDPCYEQAESEAQARIDAECGGVLSSCPKELRGEILGELKDKHEACP